MVRVHLLVRCHFHFSFFSFDSLQPYDSAAATIFPSNFDMIVAEPEPAFEIAFPPLGYRSLAAHDSDPAVMREHPAGARPQNELRHFGTPRSKPQSSHSRRPVWKS
jgi:hypothetical protein